MTRWPRGAVALMAAVVLTNSTHGADDLGYELLK
jgi:hypothetical protein